MSQGRGTEIQGQILSPKKGLKYLQSKTNFGDIKQQSFFI
jgi:hypothetical protein